MLFLLHNFRSVFWLDNRILLKQSRYYIIGDEVNFGRGSSWQRRCIQSGSRGLDFVQRAIGQLFHRERHQGRRGSC